MIFRRMCNTNPCRARACPPAKPNLSGVRLNLKMTSVPHAIPSFVLGLGLVLAVAAWGQTAQSSGQAASPPPGAASPTPSQSGSQPGAQPSPQQLPFQIVPQDPFQKAPPGVEEALRDRVAKFYQCYVDGKVRQSEEYVLPDDRDAYYSVLKPHFFGFKILDVRFKDNYTRANVAMLISQEIAIPGAQVLRTDVPRPSNWVLRDGTWYYTMASAKPGEIEHTPFGDRVVPDPKDAQRPQVLFTREDLDKRVQEAKVAIAARYQAPQPSKQVAELTPATNYQDEITITNQSPTPYHFHVEGVSLPPALVIEPSQGEMEAKGNGPLTIKFSLPAGAAAKIGKDEPTVVVVLDGTALSVPLRVKILGPGAPSN